VLVKSGRDVRVRFGRDVGIDSHGNPRSLLQSRGCGRQKIQFRRAFDIEEQDAGAQGELHFLRGLAYA